MIDRVLETFFRHTRLILLPLILLVVAVVPLAIVTAPMSYETQAAIWVDRPAYLPVSDDWNPYITPAQNQSGRLAELMTTRSFLADIAKRTSLAPLLGTPEGEERIRETIALQFTQWPTGSHVLMLHFQARTPQLSLAVLDAITQAFKERAVTDRVTQATLATSFFQGRLQSADEELVKANDALSQFIAANPRLAALNAGQRSEDGSPSQAALPPEAVDPQLGEFLRRVELAQADVARVHVSLDKAQQDASASLEGQDLNFQIVDPPQMPTKPTLDRRKMIALPAAALALGMILSTTLLVFLVATDRTAHSAADLAHLGRVVGIVPRLPPTKPAGRAALLASQRLLEMQRTSISPATGALAERTRGGPGGESAR